MKPPPQSTRLCLTLPPGLLREIDAARDIGGASRSKFVRRAVECYLLVLAGPKGGRK